MTARDCIGIALAALCAGCATVNPSPDYQRAADQIAAHTAVESAYMPDQDAQVRVRVDELLQGGLTAEESVQIALLNNRELQARFADIGVARADVVQAGLWSNPSISLGFMLPQGGGRAKLGFSLAQEIAELWTIPARKHAAQHTLDAVLLGVVADAIDVAANAKSRYFESVALDTRITITDEGIRQAHAAADAAQRRFETGEISILDVRLTQAREVDLQAKRIQYLRDAATTTAALKKALGLAQGETIPALTTELPPADTTADDEEALFTWAAQHRPDVQQALETVASAESAVVEQNRNRFPDVALSLDVERSDARGPASPPFNPLGTLITPGWTAADVAREYFANRVEAARDRNFERSQQIDWLLGPGLQMTLPVFDQNQAQIAKAQLQVWQSEKRLVALFESIAGDIATNAALVRSAGQLSALIETESLPLAEQSAGSALRLYEAGEASVLAVLDAQAMLVQTREARVSAYQDYVVAVVELERTLGGQLPAISHGPDAGGDEDAF